MNQLTFDIKNAAVIIPPIQDFYFTYHRFSSLGAKIVYKILKRSFPNAQFLNFPLMKKKPLSANLPAGLSYLKNHLIENEFGKLSYFKKYKHFGPSIEDCANLIIDSNINLCLLSCFAYCYSHTTVELAEKLKSKNNSMAIIVGGAAVSACPEFFINSKGIDYVISGEAEISLPQFLYSILKNSIFPISIPNIGWKENGKAVFSKSHVFTDSNAIEPLITKTFDNDYSIYITTSISRGCTFKCQFCSNRLSQGTHFRTVSFDAFDNELDIFSKLHTVDNREILINFEDDNILLDYEYLKKTIQQCKKYFPFAKFSFENGIDFRLLTPKRCRELIAFGVRQFNFSIGTTDQTIAKNENRSQNLSDLNCLFSILNESNIPAITYFICGFPFDTTETIISNLLYLFNQPTDSGISLFYAVPGIELSQNNLTNDILKQPYLFAGSSAFPWNNSLSTSTLITAFRLSRLVNLLKIRNPTKEEKQLIEQIISEKCLFTYIKNGKGKAEIVNIENQDYSLVKSFFQKVFRL